MHLQFGRFFSELMFPREVPPMLNRRSNPLFLLIPRFFCFSPKNSNGSPYIFPSFPITRFKVSVITTQANATSIGPMIDRSTSAINLLTIDFPSKEVGLPEGIENLPGLNTSKPPPEFLRAIDMLEFPFRQLLEVHRPDCIISDFFYWWSSDLATKFGIPRLVFHGMGFFSVVVMTLLSKFKPHESVADDETPFVVPMIPHEIKMIRSELPDFIISLDDDMRKNGESYARSSGVVMNSFYELEPEYVEFLRSAWDKPVWVLGPVSLRSQEVTDKAVRGDEAVVTSNDCSNWLDAKERGSVIYVCFGSLGKFTNVQLREIALGLEDSGHPFIWVLKDAGEMSEGFQKRIVRQAKCMIVTGWAPQILILNHPAVGGFMTHCGWNSSLEGIAAGVPMITWPLFADQFFNEKLIVDVLKIGVSVGFKVCTQVVEERPVVSGADVKKAVVKLMHDGEETIARKNRAEAAAEQAQIAVREGGSSYNSMTCLIEELIERKKNLEDKN